MAQLILATSKRGRAVNIIRRFHSVGSGMAGSNAVENSIGYAMHYSRSADAMIRVYDDAGNLI